MLVLTSGGVSFVPVISPGEIKLIGFDVGRSVAHQPPLFFSAQLHRESQHDLLRNRVLHREDVGEFLVERPSPE